MQSPVKKNCLSLQAHTNYFSCNYNSTEKHIFCVTTFLIFTIYKFLLLFSLHENYSWGLFFHVCFTSRIYVKIKCLGIKCLQYMIWILANVRHYVLIIRLEFWKVTSPDIIWMKKKVKILIQKKMDGRLFIQTSSGSHPWKIYSVPYWVWSFLCHFGIAFCLWNVLIAILGIKYKSLSVPIFI